MQKITHILFCLLAFILFPSSGKAFDTEGFAKDFYTQIRQQVEVNEFIQVQTNVSIATSLPPKVIQSLIDGSLDAEQNKDLAKYCDTAKIVLQGKCEEDIKNMITFELDLAKLNSEMKTELAANEIWANGTLADSPFDLVVDLNLIDIILFGREAKIPLAQWSEIEDDNIQPNPGKRISGKHGDNDNQNTQGNNRNDAPTGGNNTGNNNTESQIPTIPSDSDKMKGVIAVLDPQRSNYNGIQCIAPGNVIFLDLSKGSTNNAGSGNTNGNGDSSTGTPPAENKTGILLGDYWQGTGRGVGNTPVETPKLCENPLYGGYYCKQGIGGNTAIDEDKGCDPLKGVCRKCFGGQYSAYAPIQFCITWEFKNSRHSLFSSTWVEDSIRGYIESTLEEYQNLLAATPLTPKMQSNQGGFSTHPWDLQRDLGKILYVEGKIPDMWVNEAKQVSFNPEDVQNRAKELDLATKPAINNIISLKSSAVSSATIEQNTRLQAEQKRLNETYRVIQKDFSDEALNNYYKNVLFNLENIRNIFESRVEKQFISFPFEEVQSAGEKVCK